MTNASQLSEASLEQELKNKGLDKGLRLTPQDIDALVTASHVQFWSPHNTTMMVCALTLPSGYTVIGKAACIEPTNFDATIGCKIALDDARNQLWALEGYLLAQRRRDNAAQYNGA